MRKLDLTGKKFGTFEVIGPADNRGRRTAWRLRCDCGATSVRTTVHITRSENVRCSDCSDITPLADRLWSRVSIGSENECWPWMGWRHPVGHGQIGKGRRSEGLIYTHVAAWEVTFGPVPEQMRVCHRCDNPPCCNPRHLFTGTAADNTADMMSKMRHSHGESHAGSKLTKTQVSEIRKLLSIGLSCQEVASRFPVSRPMIWKIKADKAWRHA